MAKEGKRDYCIVCRKLQAYQLQKRKQIEEIRGKKYEFEFTIAVCQACQKEMDVPGLMDLNIKERDEQYRKAEGILSLEEIAAYGKRCEKEREEEIKKYLTGQVPTKEASERMRRSLQKVYNY